MDIDSESHERDVVNTELHKSYLSCQDVMVVGYKHRLWQAFLSISASGPEFSPLLEEDGRVFRPRMAADLRYTTSDVDYLEKALRRHDSDRPVREELHRRLKNPRQQEVLSEIEAVGSWLSPFNADPDWDGGAIQLCFAGHGREPDGALVLADGVLTPEAFVNQLEEIARKSARPGRLRVSVILDSCHSGAFMATVLDLCFNSCHDFLVPFDMFASCMHDEFAWEESGLGHGLFTYCISVRADEMSSIAALAVQPDNSLGPSLAIAGGEFGCTLLTAGAQNPLSYWNGAGQIEIGGSSVDLSGISGRFPTADEIKEHLRIVRDDLRRKMQVLPGKMFIKTGVSDEELRRSIQGVVRLLSGQSEWPKHEL